jgi:hypothetical protein
MATETDTTTGVTAEKVMPSITLKLRTIRKEIAATTSTWEIKANTSRDIELGIRAVMTTPSIIVPAGSLRYTAVKRLARVDGIAM